MDCQCVIPDGGWCERHQMSKPAHWVRLCQTHKDYWQAWEAGCGPGQSDGKPASPLLRAGPGTELKKLLATFGLYGERTCGCSSRAARMDRWGADECERRIDEILDWLQQEAHRRQLPFVRTTAWVLVRWAIRRSRKHAADTH